MVGGIHPDTTSVESGVPQGQQIDQDLIVSSWLSYIISWNLVNFQQNRWFKHIGHMTWKYSMVTNRNSRNFDVENKQINKWKK